MLGTMKRLAIVLLAIGVLFGSRSGLAQSRPLSARLHVSVAIDARDVFIYRYTVENGAGSTTGISQMTISLPAGAGEATRGSLAAPQTGWRATVGADATARWVAVNEASFVRPKQKLAGFSLTSHDPPSLRRFTLVPHIDPERAPVMEPGDDPGESDRYQQEFSQYVESQRVVGLK